MATLSAAQHVLGTVELLEFILLNLDTRTLLTSAQRVDRYWHEVIRHSPLLQRALFFEPDLNAPRIYNLLLAGVFPFCFPHLDPEAGDPMQPICRNKVLPIDINFRTFPNISTIIRKASAFAYIHASWRRMLVQQPPIYGKGPTWTMITAGLNAPIEMLDYGIVPGPDPSPLRMEALLTKALMEERSADRYFVSAFRVIWNPVPNIVGYDPVRALIRGQLEKNTVVIINTIDYVNTSPIDPKVLILRSSKYA
ncbi:hypothetical protein HD806DRAFT_531158 [Xylariaceae sp. AK1471]|nr:hypothetical protein HD806DRAFT_531158 [Xylariaceae sp. AK1471]